MLPINLFHRYWFFKKTNRKVTETTINDIVDIALFGIISLSVWKWFDFIEIDHTNDYIDEEESYGNGEIFMLNVMWQIHVNGYRYDFLLAMIAFLTWFKLFLYFRASLIFGPMFKILQ